MKNDDKTIYDGATTIPRHDLTNGGAETMAADDTTVSALNEDAAVQDDATAAQEETAALSGDESVSDDGGNGEVIRKGAILSGTYRVEADAIYGGMGRVWRIRHTGWNVDLALKQPKAELFQNEQQKADFINECEEWINLGLHPHIVSCYYVREIQGIPSIFSEWMAGGSLKDWIENGKLYEGDEHDVLFRLLDIAIQFARGLHYAHEQGLIHQDVKPDNLLLTQEGNAKVADFGIARARAVLTAGDADGDTDGGGTIVSAAGAYTPAYCSMEQLNGEVLTRRTDIYSWAVSVLEMFLGERYWRSGVVAGTACDEYFAMDMRSVMPEGLRELLKLCLNAEEGLRPRNFSDIDTVLLQIFQDATGKAYPHKPPKAAPNTADSLNNRALSFIDLGKPEEALECWTQAQRTAPGNIDIMYNRGLHEWRAGLISDSEALKRIKGLTVEKESSMGYYYQALIHMERGNYRAAGDNLEFFAEDDDSEQGRKLHQNALLMLEGLRERETEICRLPNPEKYYMAPSGYCSQKHLLIATDEDFGRELYNKNPLFFLVDTAEQTIAPQPEGRYAFRNLYFTPNCDKIISFVKVKNGKDGRYEVSFWNTDNRTCEKTFSQPWHSHDRQDTAVISGDGHTLAVCRSGNQEQETPGYVSVIDLTGGKDPVTIRYENTAGRYEKVYLNADGSRLLGYEISSNYSRFYLWDTAKGVCLTTWAVSGVTVAWADTTADFSQVAILGENDQAAVYAVETGELQSEWKAHGVNKIKISPQGNWILGKNDKRIRLYDARTGKNLNSWQSAGCTVFFDANDRVYYFVIAVYESDENDMPVRQDISLLTDVTPVPFLAGWQLSTIATTASIMENERVFREFLDKAQVSFKKGDFDIALDLAIRARAVPGFSHEPEALDLYRRVGKYCRITGVADMLKEQVFTFTEDQIPLGEHICYAGFGNKPDWFYLADTTISSYKYGSVFRCNVKEGGCLHNEVRGLDHYPRDNNVAIALLPNTGDSETLLVSQWNRIMRLNIAEGAAKQLAEDDLHKKAAEINQKPKMDPKYVKRDLVAVHPDGRQFATIRLKPENTRYPILIKQWDADQPQPLKIHKLKKLYGAPAAACYSPDGSRLLIGVNNTWNKRGFAVILDVNTGKLQPELECEYSNIINVDYSPDGRYFLVAKDNDVLVYETGSSTLIGKLGVNSDRYRCAMFCGNGRQIVTSHEGHLLKLWSLDNTNEKYNSDQYKDYKEGDPIIQEEYDPVSVLVDHQSEITALALSKNRELCLSADEDGTVILWRFDCEYEFPGRMNRDENVLPHLKVFLALHPHYTDADFKQLLLELQNLGYGYILPDGLRKMLQENAPPKKSGWFWKR